MGKFSRQSVQFDKKYCGNSTSIIIGTTNDSTLVGNTIHTFTGASVSAWVQESYVFQAPVPANYVTVAVNLMPGDTGFIALDNFKLFAGAVAIDERSGSQSFLNIYPNPASWEVTVSYNLPLSVNNAVA